MLGSRPELNGRRGTSPDPNDNDAAHLLVNGGGESPDLLGSPSAGQDMQQGENSDDDDNWQARAWELFSELAVRGTLAPDVFVSYAADLNVDCDVQVVQRIMKNEQMERITFKNSIRLLEVIPASVLADDHLHEEGDGGTGNKITVVVNPFEYVWRVWLCGDAEQDKEYAISNTFKCSPQFWLLFNASLVFLIVAAAITTFMSLFWLDNALDRESTNLQSLQQTLSYFSNAIASVSLEVSGKDLEDQVVTLSRWMEQIWVHRRQNVLDDIEAQLVEDATLLEGVAQAALESTQRSMSSFVEQLALDKVAAANPVVSLPPVAFLLAALEKWSTERYYDAFALNTDTNDVILNTVVKWASNITFPATTAPCVVRMKEQHAKNVQNGLNRIPQQLVYSGNISNDVGLDGDNGAFSVWRIYADRNIAVCVSASPLALRKVASEKIAHIIDKFNKLEDRKARKVGPREYVAYQEVVNDYHRPPNTSTSQFNIVTKPLHSTQFCVEHVGFDSCNMMARDMRDCYNTKCKLHHIPATMHYSSRRAAMFLHYIEAADTVVGVAVIEDELLKAFESFLVEGSNRLNSDFVKTTEIVLSIRNALGNIEAQITNFRFAEHCLIPCRRTYEGSVPMFDAFRTKGSGVSIHPDYTLRPVVGSYSFMLLGGVDVAVTIERDVPELRSISLDLIVQSLNNINADVDGTTEMMVFQRNGMPATATFEVDAACPEFTHCIHDPEHGLIWREDCIDCLRRPPLNTTDVHFLTKMRFADRCPEANLCNEGSGNISSGVQDVTSGPLATPSVEVERIDGRDYSNVEVISFVSYIRNFSAYIMVKKDKEEVISPILTSISIYIGLAVAFVLFGVIGLVILTRRTLNRIELEWRTYKESIETEKLRFDSMIREIVPSNVFQRFQRGQRAVADVHTNLSFCHINICNFSEISKSLTPKHLVRLVAYYFILYDAVAAKFKVFRLKSYGDIGVFVSGLLGGKEVSSQSAFVMAQFAGYVAQLLTPTFSHFPHRLPQIADAFQNDHTVEDSKPAKMYTVRVGLHSGQATTGLIDYGKTPFFEVYGASLSLTHRMMASAAPSTVHVSTNFKELLEISDTNGVFEFDTMRKMVIRGSGTVSSYPIKSIHLPIDEVLLHRMKIEYAHVMHSFRMHPSGHARGPGTASHADSEGSSLLDKDSTVLSSGHDSGSPAQSSHSSDTRSTGSSGKFL